MEEYTTERAKELNDAILVSVYRRFLCAKVGKKDKSVLRVLPILKAEIDHRGIDLNQFNGSAGYTRSCPSRGAVSRPRHKSTRFSLRNLWRLCVPNKVLERSRK